MTNTARVRHFLFDMGDIFYDATHWRRWLTGHLNCLAVAIDYRELCRTWDSKLAVVYVGRAQYWPQFRKLLGELGLASEQIESTVRAARVKATEIEDRTLFPAVAETLPLLRRREARLGILSDTESHESTVRRRLSDLKIEQFFDAVVTSIDIGHVKPEPEAYHTALEMMGVPAEQTAFVGHDQEELTGAVEAGLVSVAYNAEPDVRADVRIEQFDELPDLMSDAPDGPRSCR